MDTLALRFARLWPHMVQLGPFDAKARPAVLILHGCGGVRAHLHLYAEAAIRAGVRAYLVDSYAPRGWTNRFASSFVCTGLASRAQARAGDALAALWGVSQLPEVDASRMALAGWSHGGWTLMDLMTMPLTRAGEAGLADPTPEPVDRVKALFLAYPYLNLVARSRTRRWLRAPKTFGIIPRRDHLGSVATHMRAYAAACAAGAEVELWPVDATHAFDEPGLKAPERLMRHDPALLVEGIARFAAFLERAL